jgi:molecular chaperone DnaJ
MYVEVVVETPQKLTRRQRELLSEFEKLSLEKAYPELAAFKAHHPVSAQAGLS